MLDLVIKAGRVVDGTGAAARTADVAVLEGRIVEVGKVDDHARRVVDADGLLVTPGFIDIHTHFDGQATWDGVLEPSSVHGVTTVAMGNCGVGFAPAAVDRHDWLISMMEGVEDIPGTALAEGLNWEWETFPEYLDALERVPRTLDVAVHVPHAALRAYVMGDRGADPFAAPTDDELTRMVVLLAEGVAAGGIGLGTSRTETHRTRAGDNLGTMRADRREMLALAGALRGTSAVLQVVSDVYQSSDPAFARAELDLLEAMAVAAGRPLSVSCQQPPTAPERWREMQDWAAACAARGVDVWTQVAPRPIGILQGLTSSVNPFGRCATYMRHAALPLAERVVVLRRDEVRAAVLAEYEQFIASQPSGGLSLFSRFDQMFRLEDPVDYDLRPEIALASAGTSIGDGGRLLYDALLEADGNRLLYTPVFNYVSRDLDVVRQMLSSSRSLLGLSDAGAHCRSICDGSFPTTFLSMWGRDRADGFPVERIVQRLTSTNADHLGWHDRGVLAPGRLADINVIDLDALGCAPPRIVTDLPAGGSRLVQASYGYRHTFKLGVETFADSAHTGAMPGALVRGARR